MLQQTTRAMTAGATLLVLTAAFVQHRSGAADPPDGLEVMEGLEATIFAEAPMLTNPTNLDVDSRGRVWVLEGFNYRTTLHPENPVRAEGDRIVILEDTDGDGRADQEKVFYQGRDIDAAMGIAVLGNKVIVSAYENVFVFTDTDGDDRPDKKEVLFQFADKDHDHSVHAFVFGPDGRLYFNMGNEGDFVKDARGDVIVDRAGNRVTEEGKPYREGMVFRVEPDGTGFEVLGHNFRNPYEATVDSYGTVWQSDNDDDGNRGTRINYVMEYGNYGYQDEMTGAGWTTRRTGMEKEIPLRHWHLNDPGVVPNVLQTGAGSPSGIAVYEGNLLPKPLQGALIHADPGTNVVRAYPTESTGAGYRAEIVNIVKGVGDPLFRPVDVAVAPDGSLFVADWYDPGVGGHDVGDLTHGRILRVAPPGSGYRPQAPDIADPRAAVAALRSPNLATRYLAYEKLRGWGSRAEKELVRMWRSSDPRERARSLWLLSQNKRRGGRYIDAALRDPDPDIRITGLRAARRTNRDMIPIAKRLVSDPSPQVRREVALALRHNPRPEAADLWTELALQYDGQDRWYLEALGIGADRQWDRFFAAWQKRVGEGWSSSPAARNIVWRARTDAALPLLATLIRDPRTGEEARLRYFRAFDFTRSPARQKLLLGLLDGQHPAQGEITRLVVSQLDTTDLSDSPGLRSALARTLQDVKGTLDFVDLVRKYNLRDRTDELMNLALREPESTVGVEAARLVLRWGGVDRFRRNIQGPDAEAAWKALTVAGRAGGAAGEGLLEEVVLSPDRPLALRHAAVRQWGSTWNGAPRLLEMLEKGELPKELREITPQVLYNSYRRHVREGAEKYLPPPSTADGRRLPAIHVLAEREGDAGRGRAAYARVCASCHVAGNQGRQFGPGLSEIGEKLPKRALYTAILHPSAGISFGYEGYVINLRDGTQAVGIIESETADELVLKLPGGIATRYRKPEIQSRTRLDTSLMPAGLERALTEQELVDLVEYLATLRKADG